MLSEILMLIQCLFNQAAFGVIFFFHLTLDFVQISALASSRECHPPNSSNSTIFLCVCTAGESVPSDTPWRSLASHLGVSRVQQLANCWVWQWTLCCGSEGRPTCAGIKSFSRARNTCGGILAQANNSGSFAIDLSKALISPKASSEMQWTQIRTLEQVVLYPITRLLCQPLCLRSTWQNLGIFCSPCVRSTASLETGDNGNILAEWDRFVSSCAASVRVQAAGSCRALCAVLCGLPGAAFGKQSCRLSLGQCLYALFSVTTA